jgi:hypothetical protein
MKMKINNKASANNNLNWGSITWILFHSIAAKIHEPFLLQHKKILWGMIYELCMNLPCPYCKRHAITFLRKININTIKSKHDFATVFFNFHNSVNIMNKLKPATVQELQKYDKAVLFVILEKFVALFTKNYDSKPTIEHIRRKKIAIKIQLWVKNHKYGFI